MSYIPRLLTKELRQSAKEYSVIALLGPRQSGKSTLVKKAFPNKIYVSMEDLDNRESCLKDPRGFLQTHSSGAIIDEVQRVPHLLSYLQTKVDEDKKKGQFILTGSNQFLLEEKLTQSLAGRVSLLRLLPFSLKELPSQKKQDLSQLIFTGFYPQLHTEKIRVSHWQDNYIDSYVNKDVRLIKNISNLNQFNTFLKMLAGRVGQLVNFQSLSNDCGLSQNTAKSWLSLLESGFIVKKLEPYYKNFNKRLIKSPKIFFYDTGLLCRLLSIKSPSEINHHALKGFLFENFIFIELLKHFFNQGEKPPLYFWRDKTGFEIDFLIEGKILKLIETKAGQTLSSDFFKNINYFKKISKQKTKSYLIYSGDKNQIQQKSQVLSWKDIHSLLL